MAKQATAAGPVEGPWALPEGWRWERLPQAAAICDHLRRPINNAERLKRNEGKGPGELYPYYGATGQAGVIDGYLADGEYILLGEDGAPFLDPFKVKAYPVSGRFWVNNHAHVLMGKPHLDARLLLHWLNTIKYEPFVNGTTRLKLTQGAMMEMPVPVPPGDIQSSLASRIEDLFTEIDDGEAALARARDDLVTWRKALLRAAVTGELTADWRAANPPTETGADLLRRILVERGKRHSAKSYLDPAGLDASALPALPPAWAWTTCEVAGDVKQGRQRAPAHHAGDHMRPYLRVANVMEGRLDLRDVKTMNFTPLEYESYQLLPGDVLLNEGQSPELLGRPAIFNGEIAGACFQNTLLRFRPSPQVRSDYALVVFRRYMHAERFIRESRITTNLAHLTLGRFRAVEFPVPPIAEQAEIARRVSVAEASWDHETLGAPIASSLRQSILAAAFRGELS